MPAPTRTWESILRWTILSICGSLLVLACGEGDGDEATDPPDPGSGTADYRIPLGLGSEWVFDRTVESSFAEFRTTARVVGEREIGGFLYACYYDTTFFSDTTYVRQDGAEVFFYPAIFLDEPTEDPILEPILGLLSETPPWRAIDFAAPVGEPWDVVRESGEVEFELENPPIRFQAVIQVVITAENLAPASVTVPRGTFENAYHVRLSQAIDAVSDLGSFQLNRSVRDLFVADGIGIVSSSEESSTTIPLQPPLVVNSVNELVEFTLK